MKTTIITRNIYCLNKYIDSYLEDNCLWDFRNFKKDDFVNLFANKKLNLKKSSVDVLLSVDKDFLKKSDKPKIKDLSDFGHIYYANPNLDLKEHIKNVLNIKDTKGITQKHIKKMVKNDFLFKTKRRNHIIVNNFNKKWDINENNK